MIELQYIDDKLKTAARRSGAEFISARSYLCQYEECLAEIGPTERRRLVAWDDAHLTEEGASFLVHAILGDDLL